MDVDWVTWSIWFVGLAILVIWVVVPVREFKRLLRDRRRQSSPPQE